MNNRIGLWIVLIVWANLKCKHNEIVLEKVSDLPEYFFETYHFGKDIKSISELNEFMLVTGKIDTTSEFPPVRLAVVVVDHHKIFLKLKRVKENGDDITEQYSGNGYDLNLVYKGKKIQNHSTIYEGYFIIRHDNVKSVYNVVGTSGYD